MIWPWTKWINKDDTFELGYRISQVLPANYNKDDRHGDFVHVFKGSPAGLRVLQQILQWGHIYSSSIPTKKDAKPNEIDWNEGERRLALMILQTVNVEPVGSAPPRTTNKE